MLASSVSQYMSTLWINWLSLGCTETYQCLKEQNCFEMPNLEEWGCFFNMWSKRSSYPLLHRQLWNKPASGWLLLKLSIHHCWVSIRKFVFAQHSLGNTEVDLFAWKETSRTRSILMKGKEPGLKAVEALSQRPVEELFHMLVYF